MPSLNTCGNYYKFKCKYCLKFLTNCNGCISDRCKICHEFNKSKDILINSDDLQISLYVTNFLTDYFSVSDFSNQFFNINIDEKVQEKYSLYIYDGKIKKIFYYNEQKTNEEIKYQFKGKKRQYYFKK